MNFSQLGSLVKQKFQDYANYADDLIGQKLVDKYPQYMENLDQGLQSATPQGMVMSGLNYIKDNNMITNPPDMSGFGKIASQGYGSLTPEEKQGMIDENLAPVMMMATGLDPVKGEAKFAADDALTAMKKEAQKYKSAEEFVKAQQEKLYIHGTQSKIEGDLKLNSKALGVQQPESNAVDVLYVTPNTETGIMHSRMYTKQNGNTYAIELKPEAKIFDYSNLADRKLIDSKMTPSQRKLVQDNLVDGQLSWMATPPVKLVKSLGFDGMKQIERKAGDLAYSETFGDATYPKNAESIMLFNNDVFKQVDIAKTKSQLTDIYNQSVAQPPKGLPANPQDVKF